MFLEGDLLNHRGMFCGVEMSKYCMHKSHHFTFSQRMFKGPNFSTLWCLLLVLLFLITAVLVCVRGIYHTCYNLRSHLCEGNTVVIICVPIVTEDAEHLSVLCTSPLLKRLF